MKRLNIFFASNLSYAQHLAVALRSLLVNNPKLPTNVHILNSDLDPQTFAKLKTLTTGYDCILINTHINAAKFEHLALPLKHITKDTYYRLLIPQFTDSDRALYLDADVVVNGDLSPLISLDLKDFYLAAVEDPFFNRHRELELSSTSKYFNSGVMLLNLKKWRKKILSERIIEYAEKNGDNLQFADQCATNAVVNGNWLPLPPRFNQQSFFFNEKYLEQLECFPTEELREALTKPLIIHFTTSSKPWHILNNHPFRGLYWQHLRQTPFKTMFSTDLSVKKSLIWLLPVSLRETLVKLKNRMRSYLSN